MYDVYTNDSPHGVCFPTVIMYIVFGITCAFVTFLKSSLKLVDVLPRLGIGHSGSVDSQAILNACGLTSDTFFLEDFVMKIIIRSFFLFKSSCQLMVKYYTK